MTIPSLTPIAWIGLIAATSLSAKEPESNISAEIRPPDGRLAIVADGNSPDPDDIGASAVIFGLLQGRRACRIASCTLSHSCDHRSLFRIRGKQRISEV